MSCDSLISELRLKLLSTNQSVSCCTTDDVTKEIFEDIVFDTNEAEIRSSPIPNPSKVQCMFVGSKLIGHTVGHHVEHCIAALSQ